MVESAARIRRRYIALLALALLLVGAAPAFHNGANGPPPPIPSSFWGTATVNGQSVPVGITITAGHDGVIYCAAITYLHEGTSWYRLNVPGDDPDTPDRDGGVPGEEIEFTIGGLEADQSSLWQSGANRRLDLTASGVLPTLLPPFYESHVPLLLK